MEIRLAQSTDHDAIWDMLAPVFGAGETYAVPRDVSREAALNMWCTLPAATYVAELEGEVRGTFYIKTNAAGGGKHVCNCGYITHPSARGRGLARAMCEFSQSEARKLGYRAMQFNMVLANNVGAVALWHRLGFETIGMLPKVFDHPKDGLVDAHVMYKWLEEADS